MAWVKTKTTASGQKRYKVQYHGPDDRTHSKTFLRSEDARAFARSVETAKRQGDYMDPSRARTRVREYWPRFMASSPNLRQTTRDLYDGLARNHVLPILGDHRLSRLTVGDVNTFVASMEERGARPPTINAAFRLLRTMLSAAEAEGLIVRNPARTTRGNRRGTGVRLPEIKRDEMRFLEPAEVHQLANAITDRYRALVLLLGFCGLRVGEALALRVSDIELLRRRATITRTLTELSGGRLQFGEPKTSGSRRPLALPAFICEELAAHLATFPAGPEGLLFTSAKGGPVRLNYFRAHEWRKAVTLTGLGPLRIHDLRHTAVAISVKAGAHPKQIQAMCGHSSITITLDRYGHLFSSMAGELAQLVDAIGRQSVREAGAISVPGAGAPVLEIPTHLQQSAL